MKGLKKELEGKLSEEEMGKLNRSFDVVGDVAILEIPEELIKHEKEIARAVVETHPHIKTVLRKAGPREGELRLRKYRKVLGKETETVHKEQGCRFLLDPTKTYFSPREATERLRVARQVRPGERILVMFSGINPFGIVCAKVQPDCKVVGVELNQDAVRYADESVKLNKMRYQVENIQGDVRVECPKLGKFDRIIMNLPENAWEFLDVALDCSKKGGTIHLYGISEDPEMKDLVKKAKGLKVLEKKRVLPFGVRVWKVCLDLKVPGRG